MPRPLDNLSANLASIGDRLARLRASGFADRAEACAARIDELRTFLDASIARIDRERRADEAAASIRAMRERQRDRIQRISCGDV